MTSARCKTYKENLDMARVSLVRVDTTVCSVSATTGLGCLVDDNVANNKIFSLQSLSLGVSLSVFEEVGQEFDRLHGPATCNGGR